MRVLLVNANTRDDLNAVAPIGPAYVAAAAEAAGHQVRLLDLCFQPPGEDRTVEAIRHFSPDVVGVSVRNLDNANMLSPESYVEFAADLIRRIRAVTSAPVVAGGPAITVAPENMAKRLAADYVVISHGERPFVHLLDCLACGASPGRIPGVGMPLDGAFRLTPPEDGDFPDVRPNLGGYVDMQPYVRIGSAYGIQTKRGCRHRCVYCTYGQVIEGNRMKLRSPLDVVDEIEEIYLRHRPGAFEFVDSLFNDPLDYCFEILEEIARRQWRAQFRAMGVSPKYLDSELLNLMRRVGFKRLSVTPESASQTMLRNYRKGFNIEDVIRAAELLKKTEFDTKWFFLLGGPGETHHTLDSTLQFGPTYLSNKHGPGSATVVHFFGIRLYPGTDLWDIAMNQDFISELSDPVTPLWYVSPELNLERAVSHIIRSALEYPDTVTGLDEQYMRLPAVSAMLGDPFGIARSPQHYVMRAARLMSVDVDGVARLLRRQLERQGYRGSLLIPRPTGRSG